MSTLLLASGLVDKVGKQPIKLETLMCHFAKPGGHKLRGIKVQMLVTKLDWDSERWNPGKVRRVKGMGGVVVIDLETDGKTPNIKESKNTATTPPPARQPPAQEIFMMRQYLPIRLIDIVAKFQQKARESIEVSLVVEEGVAFV